MENMKRRIATKVIISFASLKGKKAMEKYLKSGYDSQRISKWHAQNQVDLQVATCSNNPL